MLWSHDIRISVLLSFHALKLISWRLAWRASSQVFLREITTRATEKCQQGALLSFQLRQWPRYEEPSWHICSPFIGHYQVMHSLYIIFWWQIFSLRPWSANILSLFPLWVRVGIFSHYHILATCHWWGEGQRMLSRNQSGYNWNFLNNRTQGQDTTVVRKKCLLGI